MSLSTQHIKSNCEMFKYNHHEQILYHTKMHVQRPLLTNTANFKWWVWDDYNCNTKVHSVMIQIYRGQGTLSLYIAILSSISFHREFCLGLQRFVQKNNTDTFHIDLMLVTDNFNDCTKFSRLFRNYWKEQPYLWISACKTHHEYKRAYVWSSGSWDRNGIFVY